MHSLDDGRVDKLTVMWKNCAAFSEQYCIALLGVSPEVHTDIADAQFLSSQPSVWVVFVDLTLYEFE
jgi:hypothetical protein